MNLQSEILESCSFRVFIIIRSYKTWNVIVCVLCNRVDLQVCKPYSPLTSFISSITNLYQTVNPF